MYLSDTTIENLVATEGLILPYTHSQLQVCSYDLTLDTTTLGHFDIREHGKVVDPTQAKNELENNVRQNSSMIIEPHEFCLATTVERVHLPKNIAGMIMGKSSIGRLGLFIHNAGHIDPGFNGQITLELFNASNQAIDLSNVGSICQIVFTYLDEAPNRIYHGKYQGQRGITYSRTSQDYNQPSEEYEVTVRYEGTSSETIKANSRIEAYLKLRKKLSEELDGIDTEFHHFYISGIDEPDTEIVDTNWPG